MFIEPGEIGERLSVERRRRGMSQRKLAQQVGVSPSLISQMESGKVQPSVATLMAVVTELGLSIDQLFRVHQSAGDGHESGADVVGGGSESPPTRQAGAGFVMTRAGEPAALTSRRLSTGAPDRQPDGRRRLLQRHDDRSMIRLHGGVVWERLTPDPDELVDFLHVTYEAGACSSDTNDFIRHEGREYLYVIQGRLEVQVVFDIYVLAAGDSIVFDSIRPHRLTNTGDGPAVAIAAVVHP